jgi:hypothetical protein
MGVYASSFVASAWTEAHLESNTLISDSIALPYGKSSRPCRDVRKRSSYRILLLFVSRSHASSHLVGSRVNSDLLRSTQSSAPTIHPERAPAEVERTLRLVGDELRGDLKEAAARVDDDTGFAQEGELLRDDMGVPAGSHRELGDHERAAVRQLPQDIPTSRAAEAGKNGFQAQSRRRHTGGFRHDQRMSYPSNRRQARISPHLPAREGFCIARRGVCRALNGLCVARRIVFIARGVACLAPGSVFAALRSIFLALRGLFLAHQFGQSVC